MQDRELHRRTRLHSLYFDDTTEKLKVVKAFNDLLRKAGYPAVHEGLDQTDPLYSVYLCIYETPVEPV